MVQSAMANSSRAPPTPNAIDRRREQPPPWSSDDMQLESVDTVEGSGRSGSGGLDGDVDVGGAATSVDGDG